MKNKNYHKIKCSKCNGIGLVKTEIKLCSKCKIVGNGCYTCKSGLIQLPWSECTKCLGEGEIYLKF